MNRDIDRPDINRLVEDAATGDRGAILRLLDARGDGQERLFAAARSVRDAASGPSAVVRGVIEITDACVGSCFYCPMRVGNQGDRYFLEADDILAAVGAIRDAGLGVVFLQGGEVPATTRAVGRLLPDIQDLFGGQVEILLCLGTKPRRDLDALRRLGASGYILKHETADPALHQALRLSPLSRRLDCARDLLALGYRLGMGTIVGLPGQSPETLAGDLLLPAAMGAHMASASPFVPAARTPLEHAPAGDLERTLNAIAVARLLQPEALIPSVSALEQRRPGGQRDGLLAGANVITVNFTPPRSRERYTIYGQDRYVVRLDHALATLAAAGLTPRLRGG